MGGGKTYKTTITDKFREVVTDGFSEKVETAFELIADYWGPVDVCARQIYPQYQGKFANMQISGSPPLFGTFSKKSSVLLG